MYYDVLFILMSFGGSVIGAMLLPRSILLGVVGLGVALAGDAAFSFSLYSGLDTFLLSGLACFSIFIFACVALWAYGAREWAKWPEPTPHK